ncbi:MAG TPA: aldo/keto reductase [Tepidisphaeraceae bacterium]|jgi:aryl-alcohol dehydrogenase-like predicted oxidoreductase
MNKTAFGKTGYQVSPLGFGAGPIGYLKTDQARITTILNTLLDSGVNLIDTAASYPGSEEAIGNAVAHRRSEFVLVSKCGQSFPDVPGEAWSPQVIAGTVDRALRRLKADHLDVMLLHSCKLDVLQRGDAVAALATARDAGKVRFAGYSGDNEAAAYAAGLPDIAVIETSVNIADQMNLDTVLPIARKNNLGVLAKRPIANAAWKDASQQQGLYINYASEYHRRLNEMRLNPADLGISGPPDQAWPELALRFTLSQAGVHTAIIGTTNPANAKANIAAAEQGPLPPATVEKIRAAFRRANPDRQWTGQQ